jgi:hypothetical protein
MKAYRWLVPVVALVTLLGSALLAQVFGWWQTSGTRITTLQNATMDDIKGSSTLGEVSTAFKIPLPELIKVLGVPANTLPEAKMKDLEAYNEVSVARGKIAAYLGIPYAASETTAGAMPAPTAAAAPAAGATRLPGSAIKGSMTLKDVSEQCGIPAEALYKELKLATTVPVTTVLSTLSTVAPGVETTTVRDAVTAYQAKSK